MNPTNKKLTIKRLNAIGAPTPFMAIDLDDISEKYHSLEKQLPMFKIFYAVKCNPEQRILETLKKQGSSFEIASIGELRRLQEIGVDAKDVIYSNPVKPESHIKSAFHDGLYRFAFDSPEELQKIAQNAPGSSVYLRLSVSNHGSLISLANKFGANKEHALQLLSLAQDLGLQPYGLAFHVGSQSESIQLWDQAFEDMLTVIDKLEANDIQIKMLNIGGGFPIRYTEKVPSIQEIATRVKKNLKKLPDGLELFCEPGRYLVGESSVIAGTVIGKTTRRDSLWLYTDVGRFQAFIEMFESNRLQYPIFCSVEELPTSKPKSLYTVTGPSCDSYDTVSRDVSLPTNLSVGDRLYFASAGAYTHVYGAPFNDFPVPEIVYLDDLPG